MITKRGWLFLAVFAVLIVLFWNIRFFGFSVLNTTSNLTILGANSHPILGSINSSLYTCEDERFYYEFSASDPDGDALAGSITPQNPFFVFWISQSTPNDNIFAIVSGDLSKADAGGVNAGWKVHQETVSVNDLFNSTCCNDTAQTNITVIEINHAPTIEDVLVVTLYTEGENSTLYEVVDANDTEIDVYSYGTYTFNVSIVNASSGAAVDLFNITSPGGVINFTANSTTPIGVYNVSICVSDYGIVNPHVNISSVCGQTGSNMSDCDNFSITVTDENRPPNITDYYPENLSFSSPGTSTLTFNITKHDPDGTIPDAYWFVDGVLTELDSGNSTDYFTHNFGCDISGNHTVDVEITDGLLNDSLQWNISVTNVECGSPGGGGGGGGGGGAGAYVGSFEVTPEFITASVLQDEGKSFDIKIKNIGTVDLVLKINKSENLTDVALLNEEIVSLGIGEEKTVRLYLYALRNQAPGVYLGKILIGEGVIQKSVSVALEIKKREALFDIAVEVPDEFKTVSAGENIKALVSMLNVGLYGTAVDVDLYLYISDFDRLILYETSKEVLAVKTNLTVDRDLFVPSNTKSGTYLVIGEARYQNITVSTFDTFNVVERKYVRVSLVLIIAIIVALILFILFIIWKRRKDRKERGYDREPD